jgi:outer membrane protein assembly factor BamB
MKRTFFSLSLAALACMAALLPADRAAAVGTRSFQLDSLDDLKNGDMEGTSVDSLGRVRAGLLLGKLPLGNATTVWSSLVLRDGSVLLGTGNEGKVLRVAQGQVSEYATTGEMAVTSLTVDAKGNVLAGTIPNGKVYKVEQGKASLLVALPQTEHVWALTLDAKSKAVFAGTGPDGKIFRIDQSGGAQVYYDSDEAHILSLAVDPSGVLYAGSSGNALLYRIEGPGRSSVLHDFPGTDVQAIAIARDGRLFVISNEYDAPPAIPRARRSNAATPAEPVDTSKQRPKPGKGRLTRIDATGRAEELLYVREEQFQSLAIGDDGMPYVGTGDTGKVYAVDDAHTSVLMADTDERQVGALVMAGGHRFVATSDPAVFHEVKSIGGPDAVWTSKPLDAGIRATFGMLSWRASGAVELSTRTGNTEKPDGTWSAWSAAMAAPGKIASPPGRFVQVRARFSRDPAAVIRSIELFFVTDNARPVVTSVGVESPSSKSSDIPSSGDEPPPASSKVKLTWKVDNPDNDKLRYRLFYRFENSTVWRAMLPADEIVTKTSYEWDTSGLPEGLYRVRVEASDELANPPANVLRHALESGTILVDNTPPLLEVTANGRRIRGRAVDGVGPIARFDFSVDPQPKQWTPFFPQDGVFDQQVEAYDVDLSSVLAPGSHIVAVRAFDAAGNSVVKTVEVR